MLVKRANTGRHVAAHACDRIWVEYNGIRHPRISTPSVTRLASASAAAMKASSRSRVARDTMLPSPMPGKMYAVSTHPAHHPLPSNNSSKITCLQYERFIRNGGNLLVLAHRDSINELSRCAGMNLDIPYAACLLLVNAAVHHWSLEGLRTWTQNHLE